MTASWLVSGPYRRPNPLTSTPAKAIVLFVAGHDIRIVDSDGELLRVLVLDPTRDYQRQSA